MDQELYDKGMKIRREVLGDAYVDRALSKSGPFNDPLQERPYHQAMGVLLNTPEAVYMGPNMKSFGHHGLGGSIGFGDPDARLGFSYCCNQMHAVGTTGPRARRLIDAVYGVLG